MEQEQRVPEWPDYFEANGRLLSGDYDFGGLQGVGRISFTNSDVPELMRGWNRIDSFSQIRVQITNRDDLPENLRQLVEEQGINSGEALLIEVGWDPGYPGLRPRYVAYFQPGEDSGIGYELLPGVALELQEMAVSYDEAAINEHRFGWRITRDELVEFARNLAREDDEVLDKDFVELFTEYLGKGNEYGALYRMTALFKKVIDNPNKGLEVSLTLLLAISRFSTEDDKQLIDGVLTGVINEALVLGQALVSTYRVKVYQKASLYNPSEDEKNMRKKFVQAASFVGALAEVVSNKRILPEIRETAVGYLVKQARVERALFATDGFYVEPRAVVALVMASLGDDRVAGTASEYLLLFFADGEFSIDDFNRQTHWYDLSEVEKLRIAELMTGEDRRRGLDLLGSCSDFTMYETALEKQIGKLYSRSLNCGEKFDQAEVQKIGLLARRGSGVCKKLLKKMRGHKDENVRYWAALEWAKL